MKTADLVLVPIVNGVVYSMPLSSSRLGIPVMTCLVCSRTSC